MPGTCAVLELNRVAPLLSTARAASVLVLIALVLAVAFQSPALGTGCGSVAASSSAANGAVRSLKRARILATSLVVTIEASLPKLVRTYETTEAIHSSSLPCIGTIREGKVFLS